MAACAMSMQHQDVLDLLWHMSRRLMCPRSNSNGSQTTLRLTSNCLAHVDWQLELLIKISHRGGPVQLLEKQDWILPIPSGPCAHPVQVCPPIYLEVGALERCGLVLIGIRHEKRNRPLLACRQFSKWFVCPPLPVRGALTLHGFLEHRPSVHGRRCGASHCGSIAMSCCNWCDDCRCAWTSQNGRRCRNSVAWNTGRRRYCQHHS